MIQPDGVVDGVGSGLQPLSIDHHGMTGKTDNTIPGLGQIFGRDAWGRFRVKLTFQETPGGLNTGSIEFEKGNELDFLENRARDQERFGLWEMFVPCARMDNPFGWLNGGRLDYRKGVFITSVSDGDAPTREASGEPVVTNMDVSWEKNIRLLPLVGSSVTPSNAENTEDINSIVGLTDPNPDNCVPGYRGPDEHLFIAGEADSAAAPEILFSRNGGGAWTPFTNSPFAVAESISDQAVTLTRGGAARLIEARLTTDASAAAEIGYADLAFGNEAAATWTNVDVGVTNGDVIITLDLLFYDRLYAAVGAAASEGEVWISQNLGETWSQIHDDTTPINAFAKGWGQDCEDVYAVGDTNLIMVERSRSGTFETLVGPSGGGDFTAIGIADNGLIYAGNGQSLFVSYNDGLNAGGWNSLKDFGAGLTVKKIWLKQGDGEHIYVLVSAAADGEFWHSNDGGNNWIQVTMPTDPGYLDGYESIENDNLYFVCGKVDATPNGVVHKVSPSVSGC
jgi:hypothetical protein